MPGNSVTSTATTASSTSSPPNSPSTVTPSVSDRPSVPRRRSNPVPPLFGDAEDADVAGGSGADNPAAASRRRRLGLGRRLADGSVAHLMAWDW
jgi:hypothetical protein